MKPLNFILLLFLSLTCFANDIDKLQTLEDVNNFLIKKVDKKFRNSLPLDDSQVTVDTAKFGRNKFFKVDIDNNSLNDLIIYGYRVFLIVLDNGKGNYNVCYLDGGAFLLNSASLIFN